jgi:predicted AAA+ superfamily ATPase
LSRKFGWQKNTYVCFFIKFGDARILLDEFLIFGGYPEVVLAKTREEKIDASRSIFDLYIKIITK